MTDRVIRASGGRALDRSTSRVERTESGRITKIRQPPSPKHEQWPKYEDDDDYVNAEKLLVEGKDPRTGEPFKDSEEFDIAWEGAFQHDEGAHHARFDRRWEQAQQEAEGSDLEWE